MSPLTIKDKKRSHPFLLYLTLLAIAAVTAAHLAGYRLSVERVDAPGPTSTDMVVDTSAPVDFTPRDDPGFLSQDFETDEPKNVILILVDGLGFAQLAAAHAVLGLERRFELERMPVAGWVSTHAASKLLSDSAAAGTALATGFKTSSGRVGMSDDGRPLKTVMEAAREDGFTLGVLTDSYLWDATPAAFLTHTLSREDQLGIARQMALSEAHYLIGGNYGDWSPGSSDYGELFERFRKLGYAYASSVEKLEGLAADPAQRILALLPPGSIAAAGRRPSLAELVDLTLRGLTGLGELTGQEKGFLLLVESEAPDTWAHEKDLGRVVESLVALDAAVARALEFASRERDTLVLLTSDHETGGLTLVGGSQGHPLAVVWAARFHSGVPVPLLAYGPGAERFGGVHDNTDLPRILARLLGWPLEPAQ